MDTQSPPQIVLEVKDLSVEYVTQFHRTPAVRNLSFEIREGEVYGLVGESGCGKSTVALACVRYLPEKTVIKGEVNLLGQDILKLNDQDLRRLRGNRVAMVYQDPQSALNPSMTIITQMEEILTVHQKSNPQEARDRCLSLMEMVRIADPREVAGRYPHQLSGGMQQRVIIAMALLLKPSLLIMDEPTTGLDVTIEAAVLDLVNDLRLEFNTAILFISHNMGVIARLCDRVGVMYASEMVEEAPVVDLFTTPHHPYTTSLLRCIPRRDSDKSDNPLWSIPGRVPPLYALPEHCIFAARCNMARPDCFETRPPLLSTSPTRRSRCLYWNDQQIQSQAEEAGIPEALLFAPQSRQVQSSLDVDDLKIHFRISGGIFSLSPRKETVKAVDGVSFEIPPRKTVGIVGESGCGKSTLARAVAGLTPVNEGKISLGGKDLTAPVNKRQRDLLQMIQMVFQNPDSTLNPQKMVEQELRRPIRLFKVASRQDEDRLMDQLLEAVNLDPSYRERYPSQLSGGEKQRVAIARAFAGIPQLVLCDEPTSSLDVSVQSMVLNLLQRLQNELGVSLMFISHDLSVVRYISDYIGVVYLGQFCEFGRVEDVFKPPYHPYTEALLSAIPVPDPTIQKKRINLEGSVPSAINPPAGCRFHTRCPRKIGVICEQVSPPAETENEHTIFCHIPRHELVQQQADLSA
jgi:peptide/nickel transport system ATP-binding protein